jgi:hypothetical protein
MPRKRIHGDRVIDWIEKFCRVPSGPHKGKPVVLSTESQRHRPAGGFVFTSRPAVHPDVHPDSKIPTFGHYGSS